MSATQVQPIVYLPVLTSIRGIAAVMVTLHHLALSFLKPWGDAIAERSQLLSNSYLWVDFFFVLSGFIMTHVYAQTFGQRVDLAEYRTFLRSRFARIYPLHLFTLLWFVTLELVYLAYVVMVSQQNPAQAASLEAPFTGETGLLNLVLNLLLLQVFDPSTPPWFHIHAHWNTPAWSISAEWLIYFIFPVLLVLLLRRSAWVSGLVYGIALVLVMWVYHAGNLNLSGFPSLVRCGAECTAGILTYRLYQRDRFHTWLKHDSVLLLLFGLMLGIMSVGWYIPGIIPVFCLTLLALVYNQGVGQQLLTTKPLLWLGTLSYSIYLVHWFVIKVMVSFWLVQTGEPMLSGVSAGVSWLIAIATLGVVLIIAAGTYHGVERPWRRRLKQLLA